MNEEEKSHNKTKFEKKWNDILKKFEEYASLDIHTDEVDMKSLEIVVDKGYLKESNTTKTFGKSILLNKETSSQANIGLSNLKKGLHHNRNVSKFSSKDDDCSDADSISLGSDSDEEDEDEEWESEVISEDDTPDVDVGFDVCSSNPVHIDTQKINDAPINHQEVEEHIEPLAEVGQSLLGPIAMSDVRVLNIVPDSDLSTAVDFNERATSSQLIDLQQCNSLSAMLINVDQNWMNEALDLRCNKHSTKVLSTIQSNHSEIVEPQKSSISIELPSLNQSQETCNQFKKHRLSYIIMDTLKQSFAFNEKEKNMADSNIRNEKMSPAQTSEKSNFLKDILNQTYTCNQNDSSVLNLLRIKDKSEQVTPAMQPFKKGKTGLMDYLNQTFISRNSTNHQLSHSPVHDIDNVRAINKNQKKKINPNNHQINTDRSPPNLKNIDAVFPKSSKCLNDTFILPKFVSCTKEDLSSQGVTKLDLKYSNKFSLTKRNHKNKLDETFLINSENDDPPNIGDGAQKSSGHTNYESQLNMSHAFWTAYTEINSSNEKNHAGQLDLKSDRHMFTEQIVENEHFIGFVLPKCPLPPLSQKISKSISMKKANLDCYVGNGLIQNVHGLNAKLVSGESKQALPPIQYFGYKESKYFSTQCNCPGISSPKIVPKFVKMKELEPSGNDFKEEKDLFLGHFSKKLHKPELRSEKFMTSLVGKKSVCESTSHFPLRNIAANNLQQNSLSPLNEHTPNLKAALKKIFLDKKNSTNSKSNCSFLVSSDNNLQTDVSRNETITTARRVSDAEVMKGRMNKDKTTSSEIVSKMLHENKIEFNLARRQFFDLTKTVVTAPSNKTLNDPHSKVHRRLSFSESIKNVIPDMIEKTNNLQTDSIRNDRSIESHQPSDDEFDFRESISDDKNQLRKNKKVTCERLKQSSVESKSIHSANKNILNKKTPPKKLDISFYERCSLMDYSFGEESETDATSNKNTTGNVVEKMEGSLKKCSMKAPSEVCLDDSKHGEDSPRKDASPKGVLKRKSEDDVFNISNYSDSLFQLNNNTKHSRRDLERPDRKCSYSTRSRMKKSDFNTNLSKNYFQDVHITSELKGDSNCGITQPKRKKINGCQLLDF